MMSGTSLPIPTDLAVAHGLAPAAPPAGEKSPGGGVAAGEVGEATLCVAAGLGQGDGEKKGLW